MKRGKPLRADPAKVREFLARGRGALSRYEPLKRSGALKRSSAKRRIAEHEGPLTPAEWRRQVYELSGRKCIVSQTPSHDPYDRRFHAHHPLDKSTLRDRGLHAYVWDPRNGVLVLATVHMQHEYDGSIARELLPARVWEFCAELDALDQTEWATARVERLHPPAGSSRIASPRRTDGKQQR